MKVRGAFGFAYFINSAFYIVIVFNTNFNIGLNNYNNNRSLFEDINDYNYIRENNYPYYSNNLDYKDYLF